MDQNFLIGYNDTVGDEGCTLTIVKDDRGGMTWKGISRVENPQWVGWKLIDAHLKAGNDLAVIKTDQYLETLVKDFYYNEFWLALQINKIKIQPIQLKFFNAAVNVGQKPATRFQQASVNLPLTGIVDQQLINALNALT
jgi:lysozyme family protein